MPTSTFNPAATTNQWANLDQNVDASINENSTNFLSPSRVLIYARKTNDTASTYKAIGVIQGWSFAEQRQIEELFEIGSDSKYLIPGRTTGQLNIQRILISGGDLANVLYSSASGETVIRTLKDIVVPVDLIFVAFANQLQQGVAVEVFRRYFLGCWINARQESLAANQAIVAESCTLGYKQVLTTAINPNQ